VVPDFQMVELVQEVETVVGADPVRHQGAHEDRREG
jgi:hypothetical protein